MKGTACRIHDDTVENFALGKLEGESLARFEEHLLLCRTCQERVELADLYIATMRATLRVSDPENETSERRQEPRQACRRKVRMYICDTRRKIEARATDMSNSGFGLTLGTKIYSGVRIRLAVGPREYTGRVAWCTPQGQQYRMGVKLGSF